MHLHELRQETSVIGYEESEQLDVEPARYFISVVRREKRACRKCAQGVSAAPIPARIVEKGLVSDAIVIDTLVSKYADHLPLYRQSVILSREAGVDISRATMDGWVMQSGGFLMPVVRFIGRDLLSGGYIQADETPVPVQMHDGRGKNHKAYLWQYSRPGGSAVFDFRTGRGGKVRRVSSETMKAYCRPTVMPPMTARAGRRWFMLQCPGRMPDASSLMR